MVQVSFRLLLGSSKGKDTGLGLSGPFRSSGLWTMPGGDREGRRERKIQERTERAQSAQASAVSDWAALVVFNKILNPRTLKPEA